MPGIIAQQASVLLLLTLIITATKPSYALDLLPESSDSCPISYKQCGSTKLPADFCCPSTSTCISLDNASSAICCPTGSDCAFISPVTCDVSQQDAALHPESAVKTTRLNGTLPTCGDDCCPFGYSCQDGNACKMDKSTASTATAVLPDTSTTTSSTTSHTTTESDSSSTTTSTQATPTTPALTFTPIQSPSITTITSSKAASAAESQQTCSLARSCPSFPSKAVVAGFFPGVVFGTILALLIATCLRHRARRNEPLIQESKHTGPQWSQRSSNGALIGISNPIASDDGSYRTDFLLRPAEAKRASTGARSMLSRTGTRVRSLFSGNPTYEKDVPPVPAPYPTTPPRQRASSTESIRVFSPPGAFAQSSKFLGPEPYPRAIARPDTTFTDLMQVVGFGEKNGDVGKISEKG
ncbi:hypothetical protein N7510_011656 [Penicillium lagena]|uniref:uncharacterized protein n=1 Tax=Penicillium lagena TaxID=94218 RepID=UPI0025401948|nr:uncharacterized protein N7510_011656 [Penicillium lagena]KAJ5602122.1 hypothetical protein N7510_011656 [Penicillium lagena]